MKIVSLFPAATEMLALIGLEGDLVGVSHECDYPPFARTLPKVTRCAIPALATSSEIDRWVSERFAAGLPLYEMDAKLLQQLKPDLIISQDLCQVCAIDENAVVQALGDLASSTQRLSLQPLGVDDVLDGLRLIAAATNRTASATVVLEQLQQRLQTVAHAVQSATQRPRVVMLEWLDPLFCAGHWSPELIRLAGGAEMLGRERELSKRIELNDVIECDPEILIIACCGYDIPRALEDINHTSLLSRLATVSAVKNRQVFVGDGNAYFNRPGPRLVDTLEMLAATIHPEIFSLPGTTNSIEQPKLMRLDG
jgi:iron complex transport system substrate-binding protein